jgi:sugar transferase (PEP-CTERM/EpsH1 system associated)
VNILYIAHRIPYPPNKGEKIRAFHQIRHLSKNHTVHLVCMVDDPADLPHIKTLEQYCASVEAVYRYKSATLLLAPLALLTPKPLSVISFYRGHLARKIAQKLETEKFDGIFVSSSAMAEYVLQVSNIAKVIDFVDVDSEKWRLYAAHHSFPLSWIYQIEAKRLAKYEEKIAKLFDHSIFISAEEIRLFQQRVNDRPISVISNGVDLDYFTFSKRELCHAVSPTIVFTGVMDYFPNIDAVRYFCQEIFPLVREAVPEVKFYIVGRNPTRHVKKLACRPNVIVSGTVPDVRPYLAKATIAVAPFRIARGVQNKVLEAMATGLPIVGTSQAFKGIEATEHDGIRIADAPNRFALEVSAFLLGDSALRQQCARQARRYVEKHHQWEDQGAKLENLLREQVRVCEGYKSVSVNRKGEEILPTGF